MTSLTNKLFVIKLSYQSIRDLGVSQKLKDVNDDSDVALLFRQVKNQ